jgi:hypothetical protein
MDQQIVPPIDRFRTQKAPKREETLSIELKTLIQTYEAVRQGEVTDAETIRRIARQFEAIANNPEASASFPYHAGRLAATLWALESGRRAGDRTSNQASSPVHDVDLVESFSETTTTGDSPKTSEATTSDGCKVTEKPLDKTPTFLDKTQDFTQSVTMESGNQRKIEEGARNASVPEPVPAKEFEDTKEIEAVFADDHARMSYEIAAKVRQLDATLPFESKEAEKVIPLKPISFDAEYDEQGIIALFFIGDFMHTNNDETVIFVRPRTQEILHHLNIPFNIVTPQSEQS